MLLRLFCCLLARLPHKLGGHLRLAPFNGRFVLISCDVESCLLQFMVSSSFFTSVEFYLKSLAFMRVFCICCQWNDTVERKS